MGAATGSCCPEGFAAGLVYCQPRPDAAMPIATMARIRTDRLGADFIPCMRTFEAGCVNPLFHLVTDRVPRPQRAPESLARLGPPTLDGNSAEFRFNLQNKF